MGEIFCLLGKNDLLLEEKIEELSKKIIRLSLNKDKDGFFLELQKNLNQRLLDDNYDLVIKNVEKLGRDDLKRLVLLLKDCKIRIIFVFKDEPPELISLLRENKIKFKYFNLIKNKKEDIESYLKDFCQKHNLRLSPQIIKFLSENTQNFDLLFQDLKKIAALGESKLTLEGFSQLIRLQPDIFKIHDFFLEKDWLRFIHYFKKFILEDKSKNNYETLKLLIFLFNSLLKIYLIKNLKREKIAGHYYYVNKLKEKAEKLNNEDLKKLISALAKTERKFKKFYLPLKDIPEDISLNYLLYQSKYY